MNAAKGDSTASFFTDRSGMGTVIGLMVGNVLVQSWPLHIEPPLLGKYEDLVVQHARLDSGNCIHLDDWGARTTDDCSTCSARRLLAMVKKGSSTAVSVVVETPRETPPKEDGE